jgi:hypothetical protein
MTTMASRRSVGDARSSRSQPGQPAQLQPETTSINEETYAAAPVSTTELVPPTVPDQIRETGAPPRRSAPSLGYALLQPASYETIVGGVAPSPFVSFLVLIGLLGLIGGAIGAAAGVDIPELWIIGGLFLFVGATMAAFVSRSA